MQPKALRLTNTRKSHLGMFLSVAVVLSLVAPLTPGALSAGAAAPPAGKALELPAAGAGAARAAARPAPAALAAAPSISATKSDYFDDPDTDGKAVPGDTITYTVQINNSGADAAGVVFNDTPDSNTTLVNGSVKTTPVAVNNSYSVIGNVRISVPAAQGLTSNDSDPDGGALTAAAVSPASAESGEVAVSPDGGFTYNPRAGFNGTDTFSYTITDEDGNTDTATVTVNVQGMIWFIDDSAPSGGDGRLTSPFDSIAAFAAAGADQQNDNIFLYSGNYAGGLTLKSGQALIGQGAGASLAAVTGITPSAYSDPLPATGGADPVIGGASGISLATNNLISGLTLANTAGAGISGTSFGTLAVADTTVNSTARALNLDTGTLDAQFDAVNVGNRTSTGILLNAVGGTANFGPTSIPNPSNSGGYGIRVTNSSAAITFASATISNTSQVFGQTDANFDGIPDTEGDGDAVSLVNNTGSFTLNGGTLSNCGTNCVAVRDSQNLTLSGVTISTPGVNVATTAAAGLGGHGVQAINLTGANFITGSTITAFNGNNREGVRFINTVSTPSSLTVTGSTFSNATGLNGILVNGRDAAQMALTVGGPTNDPTTNCTFTGLRGTAINHTAGINTNSTAAVDITVQNSTFQNAPINGLNTVSTRSLNGGKTAVVIKGNTFNTVAQTASSNTGVITVNGNATLAGNLLSIAVQGNTLQNIGNATSTCGTGATPCVGLRGIQIFIDSSTSVGGNVVVDSNTLTNVRRDGVFLDFANGANGSNVNARVTNNTIGTATARVGQAGQSGLRVIRRCSPAGSQCGRSANVLVENNTIRNGNGGTATAANGPGLYSSTEDNATLNLVVLKNDIETNATGPAEERSETRFPVGAGSTMCLNMGGDGSLTQANVLAGGTGLISLNEVTGTTLNVEQASASALAAANGIPAGNVSFTGTPNFGATCSAPPVAMHYMNVNGEYLASLPASATKAGGGFAYLSGSPASSFRADGLFAALPGLGDWRADMKSRLGGLSYGYAAGRVGLGSGLSETTERPARLAAAPPAAAPPAFSGETITLNVGTLPAGKGITITFQATINSPINATQVSNQGQVSGSNFTTVFTDDPDTPAVPGDPTVTQVGSPATISCPADINADTDPSQFSAVVSFAVTAGGAPSPTVECKVNGSVVTSPHTFPVGTTEVKCTATNGIGTPAECSFNVTVTDNQTPVINCPQSVTTNTEPGSCQANVSVGTPSVTDNDPNVTVSGTRSDGQPLGAPYSKGTTTISWTATDTAGNSASCEQTVTVNDNGPPVVTLNGADPIYVEQGSGYLEPGATATDSCEGTLPVSISGSVNTSVIGTYVLTYSATDSSGNTGTATRTVYVIYKFTGFFSPVANLPTLNVVKGGQSIPVKFSLNGNQGLNILAAGYPASGVVPCGSSADANIIDEAVSAGGSGFQYDPSTGQYTYAWKTEKSWAGTCRQLVVGLNDGTFHRANFQFK